MPGNVSEPSDGYAAVPRRRLQRGSAGGEETLLFPSRQTLHVLLPDRLLSRQGTEALSHLIDPFCGRGAVAFTSEASHYSTPQQEHFIPQPHKLLRYHGDGKL